MQCDERRRQEEEEKTKKKKGVWKLEKLEGKGEEEGSSVQGVARWNAGFPVADIHHVAVGNPRVARRFPRGMILLTACLLVYVNISVGKRLF